MRSSALRPVDVSWSGQRRRGLGQQGGRHASARGEEGGTNAVHHGREVPLGRLELLARVLGRALDLCVLPPELLALVAEPGLLLFDGAELVDDGALLALSLLDQGPQRAALALNLGQPCPALGRPLAEPGRLGLRLLRERVERRDLGRQEGVASVARRKLAVPGLLGVQRVDPGRLAVERLPDRALLADGVRPARLDLLLELLAHVADPALERGDLGLERVAPLARRLGRRRQVGDDALELRQRPDQVVQLLLRRARRDSQQLEVLAVFRQRRL